MANPSMFNTSEESNIYTPYVSRDLARNDDVRNQLNILFRPHLGDRHTEILDFLRFLNVNVPAFMTSEILNQIVNYHMTYRLIEAVRNRVSRTGSISQNDFAQMINTPDPRDANLTNTNRP